jgi:hypothetical protein
LPEKLFGFLFLTALPALADNIISLQAITAKDMPKANIGGFTK